MPAGVKPQHSLLKFQKEINLILKDGGSETTTDTQNIRTGFSAILWQLLTLSINLSTSPFRKTAQLLPIKYQILTLNFEGLLCLDIFPSSKAEGAKHTCSSYTYPRVLSALLAGSKPLVNSYLSPCQSRSE